MTNEEKYIEAFMRTFSLEREQVNSSLAQGTVEWDSISQMMLVSELEAIFNVTFEGDDIVEFTSYDNGKKILSRLGAAIDER